MWGSAWFCFLGLTPLIAAALLEPGAGCRHIAHAGVVGDCADSPQHYVAVSVVMTVAALLLFTYALTKSPGQ